MYALNPPATNPPVSQPDVSQPETNHLFASQQRERTQKVFAAIKQATDNRTTTPFRPGDISQTLRDGGYPLGSWEIRGEFSALAELAMITLDEASAAWALTERGARTEKLTHPA